MRVYIAAASREPERVRAAQAILRELGIELACDWLAPIEENLARGVVDADLSLEEQARHAGADCAAIAGADLLWLLAPEQPTTGAWVEYGLARGLGKPTLVTGPSASRYLFCALADFRADTDAAAVPLLATLLIARGGR